MPACLVCNTTTTPCWREGPQGPRTLCNACGIKWKRVTFGVGSRRRRVAPIKPNIGTTAPASSAGIALNSSANSIDGSISSSSGSSNSSVQNGASLPKKSLAQEHLHQQQLPPETDINAIMNSFNHPVLSKPCHGLEFDPETAEWCVVAATDSTVPRVLKSIGRSYQHIPCTSALPLLRNLVRGVQVAELNQSKLSYCIALIRREAQSTASYKRVDAMRDRLIAKKHQAMLLERRYKVLSRCTTSISLDQVDEMAEWIKSGHSLLDWLRKAEDSKKAVQEVREAACSKLLELDSDHIENVENGAVSPQDFNRASKLQCPDTNAMELEPPMADVDH